jgi:AAHS family 4-hydroxybenzoate transporter-like MFS transporter
LINFGSAGFLALMGIFAFALIGGRLGMNSIAGMFYPSPLRAIAAGWATASERSAPSSAW